MTGRSYLFVHLDTDDVRERSSTKDLGKQRVVRSQAMRAYRSRQRHELQGT